MEVISKACDTCGRQKQETNHWIVSLVKPGYEGIMFVPADAVEEPRIEGWEYEDHCGEGCATKRLSQWLEELHNVVYPTKGDAE